MAMNDGLASLQVYSVEFSGAQTSHTTGSFTTLRTTNYIGVGSVQDLDGRIRSVGFGSPIVYNQFVQAGTAGPLLAATGSIVFGRQFSNGSTFVVTITPQVSGTLYPYVVSGTSTYTVSGITYGGQSGLAYNWVAVGI